MHKIEKEKIDDVFKNLNFESKAVGALPIVNHFIGKLKIHKLLSKYVLSKPSQKLSHANAILLFIRNILIERNPLYKLSQWANGYDSHMVGLGESLPSILNDDRVGRSLDALFDADRASMLTQLISHTINEFNIDLSRFHNDSTTVTVFGKYKNQNNNSLVLTHGKNKDHRPDLKQLVLSLTVSSDGAVPIHYKAFDGNKTDDKTHIEMWECLCKITGSSGFIYVADSKLCTNEQMTHIDKKEGKFITVLPKTRSEDTWFRNWMVSNHIEWQELLKISDRNNTENEDIAYWGFEPEKKSKEGYRIIWYLSRQKKRLDESIRQDRISKTIKTLSKLKERAGKRKLKEPEQISKAVKAVFGKYKSENYFDWELTKKEFEYTKQIGKGRPGKNTKYVTVKKEIWSFKANPNGLKIKESAITDGIFPLITNISTDKHSIKDILLKYKYQPFIEKRNEQLKSVFDVMPVYLKLVHRIEALMSIYFIVLLLNALIERELRQSMKKKKITSLPLYPEERKCKHPTTERTISLFSNIRKHTFKSKNKIVKIYFDQLSDLQKKILHLLSISKKHYSPE